MMLEEIMIDEKDKPKSEHNEDMGLTLSPDEMDALEAANEERAAEANERKRLAKQTPAEQKP
jgi:hypothetical protein